MTGEENLSGGLKSELALRVFEFSTARPGRVELVSDQARGWLALEEPKSTFAFAEVEGDELRILPFIGDVEHARTLPFVRSIEPSWLEGANEIVIDGAAIAEPAHAEDIERYLDGALEHWHRSVTSSGPVPVPGPEKPAAQSVARLHAEVSTEWSWASANARIPQIANLSIGLAESVEHARLTVTLRDADIVFGTKVLHEGALPAGAITVGEVNVPLSARVMSQVEDRRGAICEIILEADSQVVARLDTAVDVQPRDLWNWAGDPLRAAQGRVGGPELAQSLLASFVRPNHPAVAELAREAADLRGQLFGEAAFSAFQGDETTPSGRDDVATAVDASITSIYEAIRARKIAYSEPPPGWDYQEVGQRIRDHGDVAAAGLATCMDSTVLMASVVEDVGLNPVLMLVRGHIFIGYWRHDPEKSGKNGAGDAPDWYPRSAVVDDISRIGNLVSAGYLGLIETTALTIDINNHAEWARSAARNHFARAVTENNVTLIDVAAARKLGVSPLPAVTERPDGVTEVFEYRVNAPAAVARVETDAPEAAVRERRVDTDPPRYRGWKSSLFSLNATNALLNLGSNARAQPIALPAKSLGELEDMLNQDKVLSVHSGFDLPEVWAARGTVNAVQLLSSATPMDEDNLVTAMRDRILYVQRFGRAKDELRPISESVTVRELRSMAHNSKTAREERGMNPLYLCFGILRWTHSPGKQADAPLILVPVNLVGTRGGREFTLSLDATQQTTTNAALIEWLRREHGLSIPGLAEPIADRAGIDVDAVIAEVQEALIGHKGTLQAHVVAEARLATLDLSAFRMWQDLNTHADAFLQRPLVRHLVETPTEEFQDAAAEASIPLTDDEVEKLETPIPADSTQKRAVLWAKQGRTFVLQGPPGTGKSQTITNIVAECVLEGMRVLFVAEKGTALAIVQRRLDTIGLSPFTLNLHHEGSNSVEVRASLQRAMTASVNPDAIAMESARRRLRNARFELTQYPAALHSQNAAGHSAYSANDELIVLDDGPAIVVPVDSVARHAESLAAVRETFQDLQRWTSAAGVRPDHAWRLAGAGAGDPFDVDAVRAAFTAINAGLSWAESAPLELKVALADVIHPHQLDALVLAANPALPRGTELAHVLDTQWARNAPGTIVACEQAVEGWRPYLHGFSQSVIELDLASIATTLEAATASSFIGRKGRQEAALNQLGAMAPAGLAVTPLSAPALLHDLSSARDAALQIRASIASVPGLAGVAPANPFAPDALAPARARVAELAAAASGLRGLDEWTLRVSALAEAGHLDGQLGQIAPYATAWTTLFQQLAVQEDDFAVWRGGKSLAEATRRHSDEWKRESDYDRLLGLQQWCALVRRLECMRAAGLHEARSELLGGSMTPDVAEDALARGVARASLDERVRAAGLDRFDAVAHDQRVDTYAEAQLEARKQWVTDGPARLLERRGGGGRGARTGGLARELEKTTRRLGTRAILRKYGEAVQELTPLVLASPASVVDLIDPTLMEFDLVIFDEASQITVPEAIGALGRARAAVVVGDSKQMPPTRRVGGGSNDEEIEDGDAEEILEDQESILSECELARVPTLSLNWHYRSQDEQLIAFSNRKYYKGDLSSFPTPTLLSSETGVEFRRVAIPDADAHLSARGYRQKPVGYADGRYLRAGSTAIDLGANIRAGANTNPAEAVAIVEAVRERLAGAGANPPSIGIVTFNEPQRELIEDLLLATDDAGIRASMDVMKMGRSNVLFIKALEQVQGDERDIIIFSVAFSKQANGKIPTNFGPLSNSGGERRLNVAITRAVRKNIVFCSFDPAELDVEGSAYDGPKHFKEFLVDAARTNTAVVDTSARVPIRDRHRDDIAEVLRGVGLHVRTDVGMSNFRLDLVLARAETPEKPVLPVLLDGESWTRRTTVSDRDVLPLEVLKGLMGWPSVARIWWPMWMQNRELVVSQILEAVAAAESAFEAPMETTDVMGSLAALASLLSAGEVADSEVESPLEAVPSPKPMLLRELRPEPPEIPEDRFEGISAPIAVAQSIEAASPPVGETDITSIAMDAPTPFAREGTFVPAHASVVGVKDVLDELPRRAAAAQVREQIADVIQTEGPVEVARLTRIVARRFGLNAVRTARAEEITKLIPRGRLKKGPLGAFAWPEGLDPQEWTGYRSADVDGSRSLGEVAPEEIANAMKAVRRLDPALGEDDVLRRTAEVFGISRLGVLVKSRLAAVYQLLPDDSAGA